MQKIVLLLVTLFITACDKSQPNKDEPSSTEPKVSLKNTSTPNIPPPQPTSDSNSGGIADYTPDPVAEVAPKLNATPESSIASTRTYEKPVLDPIKHLRAHLTLQPTSHPPMDNLPWYKQPITKDQAAEAVKLILTDQLLALRKERNKEHSAKAITIPWNGDAQTLRYEYKTYGARPIKGHSLYISMHGGGGAPPLVNDKQWHNQIRLYKPEEGIYLAPRAPTNTWDLWHQPHIDALFDRLIENFIVFEGINPNKVYILGYSAGGDGTYQLAPRMADRWAGAAMMAGHPGDASHWNLRNLPYFIQCGGKDHAYDRNKRAAEWGMMLDDLSLKDPGGYPHKWIVHPRLGHWMNLECKQALPWMARYTRYPWPQKLHWHQDNVTHNRFYWFHNPDPKPNQLLSAKVQGQTITLTDHATQNSKPKTQKSTGAGDYTALPSITLRLSDHLVNLDKPLTVNDSQGNILFQGKVSRTIEAIHQSLIQRPDSTSAATSTVTINFPN